MVDARVYLIEDSPRAIERFEIEVLEGDFSVVGIARTYAEAMLAIPTFTERQVHVAVLDSNLTPGKHDGEEGEMLLKQIRLQANGVKVISFSTDPLSAADVQINKESFEFGQISAAIAKL